MRCRIVVLTGCVLVRTMCSQALAEKPKRLHYGLELRGRFEQKYGLKYTSGADDTYYLQRTRLQVGFEPHQQLRLFAEAQDARAPAFSRRPTPASFSNPLDLRQAYFELGRIDGRGALALRAGRQELRFGEGRLIGPSNWSNNARTWDAVRAAVRRGPVRIDAFAAALVPADGRRFDRPALNNGFYGLYSTAKSVDAYLLWKTGSQVRGESGRTGDLDVYTVGGRSVGRLSNTLRYGLEIALQTGQYADDAIRAWAGHWRIGRAWPERAWKPELLLEYDYATGDQNPHDRRHATFDQLFPTNHDKYGTADRITWRNLHNARTGVQLKPAAAWTLSLDLHNFWLANRADGLYTDGGRLIARNHAATSSYVGPEVDVHAVWQLSPRIQVALGYSHLFAGAFLRQSVPECGSTYPYVTWTYKLDR